jgi:hypothetical protein
MVYKNKKLMMVVLLLGILTLLYFTFRFREIEYSLFGLIGVVWASILYILALFEYFLVEDTKITHVYRLGLKKDEVKWQNIKRVFIISDSYFKAIRIDYGEFIEKDMVINSGIKGYRELIKIILDKTKNNPDISVDKRLDDFLG